MRLTQFAISFLLVLPISFAAQLELVLQTGHNFNIQKVQVHPSQNYCLSFDEQNVLVVWDLNLKSQYSTIALDKETNDVAFFNDSIIAVAKNNGLEFWNFKKEILVEFNHSSQPVKSLETTDEGFYYLSDQVYKRNKLEEPAQIISNTLGLNLFTVSESGNFLAGANEVGEVIFELSSGKILNSWKTSSFHLGISDYNRLVVRCEERAVLRTYKIGEENSLISNNVLTNIKEGYRFNVLAFKKNFLIVGDQKDVVSVVDLETKKLQKQFKNHGGSITAIDADLEKDLLVIGGEGGVLNVYNLTNTQRIGSFESISAQVTAIDFKDEVTMLLGYADGTIKEWNLATHQVISARIKSTLFDKVRNTNYSIIAINEGNGRAIKTYTKEFPSSQFASKQYSFTYSNDLKQLKLKKISPRAKFTNGLMEVEPGVYQLETNGTKIKISQGAKILEYCMHPSNNYLMASVSDGFLYWIDSNTGEVKLKLVSPAQHTFFYITPDNYYYGSKSAMKFVGARLKEQLIGFEQVDLLYNRPDKVMQSLPFFEKEYLSVLKEAYQKRLNKLGIVGSANLAIDQLPEIETNLSQFPIKTNEKEVQLQIKTSAKNSAHILINGVPIFGKKGLTLDENGTWSGTIILSEGANKIQIYVEDPRGFKSIRDEKNIYCTVEAKSELYVLTIGSGKFINSEFDLKYASKDAEDMIENFKKSKQFDVVHTSSLIGKDVSKETVYGAIKELEKAKFDDVVLVFFAGHGILDAELDYYLSTYEMNFDQPSEGGLLFNDLEDELSKLNSRNRILLIDACHSGEIDKEEIEKANKQVEEIELVEFRSGTSSVGWIGGKSVFELSKNIFVDLRENSGVVTISSAGGAEYAMEGEIWKNGVFTYCILNGLQNMEADINGDKKIYTSELQEYLFKEVPRITNGKQTPTTRVEILDQNIRLW